VSEKVDPPMHEPGTTPSSRSRKGKRWLLILLFIAVFMLGLVVLGPSLVSTGIGESFIQGKASDAVAGNIEIGDVSLGWFSGQSVSAVIIKDPAGQTVCSISKIDLPDVGLFALVTGSRDFGTITIDGLELDLKQDQSGVLNLLEAVGSTADSSGGSGSSGSSDGSDPNKPLLDPAMRARVVLSNANINYAAPGIDPVSVSNLNTEVDLAGPESLTASLKAQLAQASHRGEISVDSDIKQLFTSAGHLQINEATINADVGLKGVPIELIDSLGKQDGKLVALVGNRADVKLLLDGPLMAGRASVAVQSENLKADVKLQPKGEQVSIEPGASAVLHVTPAAWTKLRPGPAKLLKPFDIELDIEQLQAPLSSETSQLHKTKIQLAVRITDISIDTNDPKIGQVALKQTQLDLASPQLGQSLRLGLNAVAVQNGQSGQAQLNADVTNPLNDELGVDWNNLVAKVAGRINELSLAVVDQLAGTDGLIVAALGPQLNSQLDADLKFAGSATSGTGMFSLIANSQHLDTSIKGALNAGSVTLQENSVIKLAIQPALIDKLLTRPGSDQPAAARLVKPVSTQLTFRKLNVPMTDGTVHSALTALDAELVASEVLFATGDAYGQVAVRGTRLELKSPKVSERIDATFRANAQQGSHAGEISLTAAVLDAMTADGKSNMAGLKSQTNLTIRRWPVAVLDQFVTAGPVLTPLLGPVLNARLVANVQPTGSGKKIAGDVSLTADAQHFSASLTGDIADQTFTAGKDSHVKLAIAPQTLAAIFTAMKKDPATLELSKPANIRLNLEQLSAPLSGDTSAAKVALSVLIDQLAPVIKGDLPPASLSDIKLAVAPTTLAGPIKVDLIALARQGSASGKLSANATVTDPTGDNRTVKAAVTLRDVPTSALDALAMQEGKLVGLLGANVQQLTLNADLASDQSATFAANAKSENLTARLGGSYQPDSHVQLDDKSTVTLQLTPQGYAALTKPAQPAEGRPAPKPSNQMTLLQAVPLTLDIASVYLPLKKGGAGDKPLSLSVTLSSPAMRLRQADGKRVNVTASKFAITSPDGKAISVKGNTSVALTSSQGKAGQPGTLNIDVQLKDLFDDAGKLQLETAPIYANISTKAFPVDPLDAQFDLRTALGFQGPVSDVVGKTIDLEIDLKDDVQAPGHMSVKINSDHVKSTFSAAVPGGIARTGEPAAKSKPMIMNLREDSVTTVEVTEAFAKEVLAKINPLFINAIESDKPIKLIVKQEGMAVPLKEFEISKASMDAQLSMGKLTCSSGGLVRILMRLLRQPSTRTVTVEVTPFNVHLEKGVVSYSRYVIDGRPQLRDMIASLNGIELGFRGNVYLDTRLLALETAFYNKAIVTAYPSVAKYVEKDDAIVVGLTGTIDKPQLDNTKLASEAVRIGARAAGKEYGGYGEAAGKLIDILGGKKNDGSATQSQDDRRAPEVIEREEEEKQRQEQERQQQEQQQNQGGEQSRQSGDQQQNNQVAEEEQPREKTKEEKRREQIEQGIDLLRGLLK